MKYRPIIEFHWNGFGFSLFCFCHFEQPLHFFLSLFINDPINDFHSQTIIIKLNCMTFHQQINTYIHVCSMSTHITLYSKFWNKWIYRLIDRIHNLFCRSNTVQFWSKNYSEIDIVETICARHIRSSASRRKKIKKDDDQSNSTPLHIIMEIEFAQKKKKTCGSTNKIKRSIGKNCVRNWLLFVCY